MKIIRLVDYVGDFAENKDKAKLLRTETLIPLLDSGENITLDFDGIDALISNLFRKYGIGVLDKIEFKNCNETVKKIINIVSDYMQEAG
jgi:STAS-like domain of unknown function (DUF4325)